MARAVPELKVPATWHTTVEHLGDVPREIALVEIESAMVEGLSVISGATPSVTFDGIQRINRVLYWQEGPSALDHLNPHKGGRALVHRPALQSCSWPRR